MKIPKYVNHNSFKQETCHLNKQKSKSDSRFQSYTNKYWFTSFPAVIITDLVYLKQKKMHN